MSILFGNWENNAIFEVEIAIIKMIYHAIIKKI